VDTNNRAYQISEKGDKKEKLSIGLESLDNAVFYHLNNKIRLSVQENGEVVDVPTLYGNAEKWSIIQKNGYLRDRDSKIQAPLLVIKQDTVKPIRELSNKLDANNPLNSYIFEKEHTLKNIYDKEGILTSRAPLKEYYKVTVPDYVEVTYNCVMFTNYVSQMNKLIEDINFASNSYWGKEDNYRFRVVSDTYKKVTEYNTSKERVVKTEFNLILTGYVIPNNYQTSKLGPSKFFSKSSIKFNLETSGDLEIYKVSTAPLQDYVRSYDTVVKSKKSGLSTEEIGYVTLNKSATADSAVGYKAVFENVFIVKPPSSFTGVLDIFQTYINGRLVTEGERTVTQVNSAIEVDFSSSIGFTIGNSDQIILVGKIR
jgi:hypothetical protein